MDLTEESLPPAVSSQCGLGRESDCEVPTGLLHVVAAAVLMIMAVNGHMTLEIRVNLCRTCRTRASATEGKNYKCLAPLMCAHCWPRLYSAPISADCVKARGVKHLLTISFTLQHFEDGKEDHHQHQGAMEAAKC